MEYLMVTDKHHSCSLSSSYFMKQNVILYVYWNYKIRTFNDDRLISFCACRVWREVSGHGGEIKYSFRFRYISHMHEKTDDDKTVKYKLTCSRTWQLELGTYAFVYQTCVNCPEPLVYYKF